VNPFWPPAPGAQGDYEALREVVLKTGNMPDTLTAARFARRGLGGLIVWPESEPVFVAAIFGAHRAPWTPHMDPRVVALAEGYELLLSTPTTRGAREETS
jgi:hypothetical protein